MRAEYKGQATQWWIVECVNCPAQEKLLREGNQYDWLFERGLQQAGWKQCEGKPNQRPGVPAPSGDRTVMLWVCPRCSQFLKRFS